MKLSHSLQSLGLTALLGVAPTCFASTWVITDSAHPVEVTADIHLVHLDRLDQLEAELSSLLPSDPDQAQALFQESLTAEAAAEISQAHQDVVDAWSLGVIKMPAVVVDQRYVVYGDPNLEQALAKIEQFRRGNHLVGRRHLAVAAQAKRWLENVVPGRRRQYPAAKCSHDPSHGSLW